jgi:hypothetical protein
VAPLQIRVRFEPTTRSFELAWDGPRGPEHERAAALDDAVRAAYARLVARGEPVTEPAGDTSFAEAMRELIECTAPANTPSAVPCRPALRLVR